MKTEPQGPTVTFNNPNVYEFGEELEADDVYANAEICTVDKTPATSDKKIPSIIQSFSPVAVCWGILLVIMALRIHFTSVLSAKLSDQMISSEEYDRCSSTEAILKLGYSNLQIQKDKMAQAHSVLERNITNLRGENQRVKEENQQLKEENQQVKEENQQVKEENQQVKSENQQVKDENQQVKSENQQVKSENLQVKSENQQVKAENLQVKSENQRVKEENLQVKAANLQVKEENLQMKEENLQVKEENQQVKAENLRLRAENEQLKAENQRLTGGQYTTPWSY